MVKARKFWWMLQRRCVFRYWGSKLSPSLIARSPLSDSGTCRPESSSAPQHRLPLPFSCTHLMPQHFPSAQAPSQSPHLVFILFSLHKMPSTIQRASPYPSKPYPKSLVSIITSPVSLDIFLTSYQNFQKALTLLEHYMSLLCPFFLENHERGVWEIHFSLSMLQSHMY